MKKVLAFFIYFLVNIPPTLVFAKGGGFGNLMRERTEFAYNTGYSAGYAAAFTSTTVIIGVIVGLIIGAAIGYFAARKFKSS